MPRIPFLISLVLLTVFIGLNYFFIAPWLKWGLLGFIILIFIIAMFLRRRLMFMSFFNSPYNVLVHRKTFQIESDIDSNLMFEKMKEVITESDFKVLDLDEKSKQILAGTSVNFFTWGENVYLKIKDANKENSVIDVVSSTVFGSNSWGRHDQNFQHLIDEIENALIV